MTEENKKTGRRLSVWWLMPLLFCGWNGAMAGSHDAKSAGVMRPAAIYHNYCSVCHGDKGDGQSRAKGGLVPPPRDFTALEAAQLSRERMMTSVRDGHPGTAMVAWKTQLTEPEMEAVVDYIRGTFMRFESKTAAGRGRLVYMKNCSVCHGDKGNGAMWGKLQPPPRDFTSPKAADLSRERMVASVTYGRPETAMAGFGTQLSKDDIDAVVNFIREAFMPAADLEGVSGVRAQGGRQSQAQGALAGAAQKGAPVGAAAKDMSAPMPKGLAGDTVKGAAFYMQNCAACHGAAGDGRGPRAYFINPKPRNFLHEASRHELNRPALFQAIAQGKLGTEMPAWNKVLNDQEIANAAEFVFQRFIRPSKETAKSGSGGK
ncbi:MAG: c-type cytochrome [Hydrogenophilales bacterium]|nr:c-type cytochrome [Hydrogenophilales bacterium]